MKKHFLLTLLLSLTAVFFACFFSACSGMPSFSIDSSSQSQTSNEEEKNHQNQTNTSSGNSGNYGGEVEEKPEETLSEYKQHTRELLVVFWNDCQASDENNVITDAHSQLYEELLNKFDEATDKETAFKYESELYALFNEISDLQRGGFYITVEYVPYKEMTDEKGNTISIANTRYWSDTFISYEELVKETHGKNSLFTVMYWDRYVTKLNGSIITNDYVFTKSETIVCYENEPDFHITEELSFLSGQSDTKVHDAWGSFTFWTWYTNGADQNSGAVMHKYYQDMAIYPLKKDGILMQPEDIFDSDCTLTAVEQKTRYKIDVVIEIDGETYKEQSFAMFYAHSVLDFFLYDTVDYQLVKEDVLSHIGWFDIYFNGTKIEKHNLDTFIIEKSGTLKLVKRENFEVSFSVTAYTQSGDIYRFGPYYTIIEGIRFPDEKGEAMLSLDEFMKKELGLDRYEEIFSGLSYYDGDYLIDNGILYFSGNIIAKIRENSNPPAPPEEDDLQRKIDDALEWMESNWEELNEFYIHNRFRVDYIDFLEQVKNVDNEDELEFLLDNYEWMLAYVRFYQYIEKDFEENLTAYQPTQTQIAEINNIKECLVNTQCYYVQELNDFSSRYEYYRQQILNNKLEDDNEKPDDSEDVIPVPDGFPESVRISPTYEVIYFVDGFVVEIGSIRENGNIVNIEGQHLGTAKYLLDDSGNKVYNENGFPQWVVTLTMNGVSHTYIAW